MIRRRALELVCCLASVPISAGADDITSAAEPRSSQTFIPYTSIYADAPSATRDGRPLTRIHNMLVRRLEAIAPDETVKAWVLFRDKGIASLRAYTSALDVLHATYNRRATERRMKRRSWAGLFDEYDVPVVPAYVAQVEATGAHVHLTSRWVNGVSVEATAAQLDQIDQLPFVRIIQPVQRSRGNEPLRDEEVEADMGNAPRGLKLAAQSGDGLSGGSAASPSAFYGLAGQQLTQINLPAVHDLGFTGRNVVIGILDTGFRRGHLAFNNPAHPLRIVAEWDFVDNDPNTDHETGDPGNQASHGTYILGVLGAYMPESLVGGAYDASFILCKTEDTSAEYQGEEDNYVAGLEFIEAHGGDMATASLAYLGFDDPDVSYTQEDLDGLTAITTIGVNVATANGVHCCNAAGNASNDSDPFTSHLLAPADALEVITVGAVNDAGTIAEFSSDGPTADGRVKPEVLARGVSTFTVNPYSTTEYTSVNGTSLSTPVLAGAVACLVDAYPDWSVQKMREALFDTADYFVANGTFDPTYVRGYGIIHALDALRADCNDNDVNDQYETLNGFSPDCNNNGIPDECERDCNENGAVDACELAQTFAVSSPRLERLYYGSIQTYAIGSPPRATGEVTLSFAAVADLGDEDEYISVTLNNNSIEGGDIFVLGASDCPVIPDVAQIVLPAERFNEIVDGGALVIRMLPTSAVQWTSCGSPSHITVTLAYDKSSDTPDCNGNLIPDSCDVAGDLDGDGFISLSDHARAFDCLSGPCPDPPCDPALYTDPCCVMADFDQDGDFDLKDLSAAQLTINH